jgi:hypothetical protein
MQHGTNRTANSYADVAIKSAKLNGEHSGEYGVVALRFTVEGDHVSGVPYWTNNGWKLGDQSLDTSPGLRISSYEVMDKLLSTLSQSLPNLEKVILAGHSAGGQFMDRYVAGGHGYEALDSDVFVGTVAANPSSWLWFDGKIRYPYGTGNLNPYMKVTGIDGLKENMANHEFAIFLGTDDDFNNGDMDTSKLAMQQGDNRHERGINYNEHLEDTFGKDAPHYVVEAEGIGHSSGGMFKSNAGQDLLWDDWHYS